MNFTDSIELKMTHYVLLHLIFLSQLVLHSAQEFKQTRGCSSFRCGKLGEVGFPFADTTNPECGLFHFNCTGAVPKVQVQERWYEVRYLNFSTQTIDVNYRMDPTKVLEPNNGCRLVRNFTSDSPSLSLNITESHQLIKCKKHKPRPEFSHEFRNYSGCKDYDLYFYDDQEKCLPTVYETPSNSCMVVHLPSTSLQSLQLCLADNLTLPWDGIFRINWQVLPVCVDCRRKGGQCLTTQDRTFKCSNSRKGSLPALKIWIALSTVGSLCLILMLLYCWKREDLSTNFLMYSWKRQNLPTNVFCKREKKAQKVMKDFLKNDGFSAPKHFDYQEIKKITGSFNDKVGHGGYGDVYKGKLLDGTLVAVKLLNEAKGDGEEFINEVASISRTSHVNIVRLLGFCFDGSKRALIYEFMANGSLEKFIYDHQSKTQCHLTWKTLYDIAVGVARGLEYLHRGCHTRILHFDIKPHNILLDQDFTPKISDFGLAKLCPRNESIISMLGARGTAGYIAPEVFSRSFGGVSNKSDVYSYGMMVLEIVGRRKNTIDVRVGHTSEIYFPHWIYKRLELDEELGLHGDGVMSNEEGEMTRKMILVALWCIQTNPMDRPSMSKVVEMLEGTPELLSIPPKPYLCSPTRDEIRSSKT